MAEARGGRTDRRHRNIAARRFWRSPEGFWSVWKIFSKRILQRFPGNAFWSVHIRLDALWSENGPALPYWTAFRASLSFERLAEFHGSGEQLILHSRRLLASSSWINLWQSPTIGSRMFSLGGAYFCRSASRPPT